MARARVKKIAVQWLEELFCDAVGVVLMGPAFICALGEFASIGGDIDRASETHPPYRRRLEFALRVLIQSDDRGLNYKSVKTGAKSQLDALLTPWQLLLEKPVTVPPEEEADAATATIQGSLAALIREAAVSIPKNLHFRRDRFRDEIPELAQRLRDGIPPTERIMRGNSRRVLPADLQSILNAGWVSYLETMTADASQHDVVAMNRFQQWLTKALEDSILLRRFSPMKSSELTPLLGSASLRGRLYGTLDAVTREKQLVVTPLLENSQVDDGSDSIDLRLGAWFLIQERSRTSEFDAASPDFNDNKIRVERLTRYPYGQKLMIHPNQFVLGTTLEYLSLPGDLRGYVIGRSSWGRLGLVIATATGVHPYYRGCLTLELANVGEVPIALWPGVPIAQLFLHRVDGRPQGRRSNYDGAVLPESSRLDLQALVRKLRGD